jgi:hypothetical protein
MKKSAKSRIRRVVAAIMAATMLISGATMTVKANDDYAPPAELVQEIVAEPFASEHISSWSPLLSRTQYGASVTFVAPRSGTIRVELQNSSGTTIASFTETFSNRGSIAFVRNRNTPAGTYRIRITVTINNSPTVRYSRFMNLS